ncbi:hypothetical protein CRG98_046814 [Punica granatum]|uniref:Knottin scorpion toxin-like domain-containing protein n=1 Tax=Punica granatum TaxID=22663 RepID=A0A2I0HME0_PUNGR|nr:hypothetical protein CRG98_046814 [Punica granatum]
MKAPQALSSLFLVLLLVFSDMMTVRGGYAARIPEHTCHKQISLQKCHPQKCFHECSKEPYGYGECKGRFCVCTYYCKFPPQ